MGTKKISRNRGKTLKTASRHWTRFTKRTERHLGKSNRTKSGLREFRGRRRLGYSLGCRLVHFQLIDVLFFTLLERLSPFFDEPRLLTQAGHLRFGSERFGLSRQRLLVEFLLLLLQPAVFGLGAGQVILAPGSVALLTALVPGRNNV
jgi:hypothetical protein